MGEVSKQTSPLPFQALWLCEAKAGETRPFSHLVLAAHENEACKEDDDKLPATCPGDKLSLQLLQTWIFFSGLPSHSGVCTVKAMAQVVLSVPALFVMAQTCTSLTDWEGQAAIPLALYRPITCQKDHGLPASTAAQGSRSTVRPGACSLPLSPKIQPCPPASTTRISALCSISHACPSIHFHLYFRRMHLFSSKTCFSCKDNEHHL